MPITAPAWVSFDSAAAPIARAMPKSATFTCPFVPIRMFAGLTSRWTSAGAVGEPERGGHLAGDLRRLLARERSVGAEDVGQRAALHVLHGDEVGAGVLAPVVDVDDVGMAQVGRRLRLAAEPLDEVGVGGELGEQHLDRHLAIEQQVAGDEHVGHTAATDSLVDLVAVVENDGIVRGHSSSACVWAVRDSAG